MDIAAAEKVNFTGRPILFHGITVFSELLGYAGPHLRDELHHEPVLKIAEQTKI